MNCICVELSEQAGVTGEIYFMNDFYGRLAFFIQLKKYSDFDTGTETTTTTRDWISKKIQFNTELWFIWCANTVCKIFLHISTNQRLLIRKTKIVS